MKIKEIIQVYSYNISGGCLDGWQLEYEKRYWFPFDELYSDKATPSKDGVHYIVVCVLENDIGQDEPGFIYIDDVDQMINPDAEHYSPFTHIYLSGNFIKENDNV